MKIDSVKLKIGVDIHGVIDRYDEFRPFCSHAVECGDEVHIVTGSSEVEARDTLAAYNIKYTNLFSIVDYNREIGTKMWDDDPRGSGWWMDKEDWVKSKGIYAKIAHLNIHFDNELQYAEYFPDYCTFVLVPPNSFDEILPLFQI